MREKAELVAPWDRLLSALHSWLCYIALMGKIKADAWKCDLCGHVWLVGEMYPKQCAKCRSRIWNCDGEKVVESPAVVIVAPTSKPAAKIVQVGCKCGGSGVTLVGGKRCCAGCGRALGD
jgi:hypothetical protein